MFRSKIQEKRPMECRYAQLYIIPYIKNDPSLSRANIQALEDHLLLCHACRREYHQSRLFVNLLAASFAQPRKAENSHPFIRKILAFAACLIAASAILFLAFGSLKPDALSHIVSAAPSFSLELLTSKGVVPIPADHPITTGGEPATLIVSRSHFLMLNAETSLSVAPFVNNGRNGYEVMLQQGEILANVKHDGNPFIVITPNGRAVITGTIFDIKASAAQTTLAVVEGSVRLESQNAFVNVTAGQLSQVTGLSILTKPKACNIAEITGWADNTKFAARNPDSSFTPDSENPADIHAFTDLNSELADVNLPRWAQENSDWFKREFPWIFQFKQALAAEGISADYPDLLIQSSDLRQFNWRQSPSDRIPNFNFESVSQLADRYGFDSEWLLKNIKFSQSETLPSDLAAEQYAQWSGSFELARKTHTEIGTQELLCSLHASGYIANTTTLLWLAVRDNLITIPQPTKKNVMSLLEQQTIAAQRCSNAAIYLISAVHKCTDNEYSRLIDQILDNIAAIEKCRTEAFADLPISQKKLP